MPKQIEFEGQTHEFPDDFTDEEIAGVLGGPPQQAAPGIPRNVDEMMPALRQHVHDQHQSGRSFQVGSQAVGRGIADLIGGGPDLVNTGANLLLSLGEKVLPSRPGLSDLITGPKPPFRFRTDLGERIANTAGDISTAVGVPPIEQEDMSPSERTLYAGERFGTAAGVGGSGLAAARAAREAIGPATTTLGKIGEIFTNTLGRPYKDSAVRPVAGDIAGGFGAGAVGEGYNEVLPEDWRQSTPGQIGGVLANLIGGVGGTSILSGAELAGRGAYALGKQALTGNLARDLPPGVVNPATGLPYTNSEVTLAAKMAQQSAMDPRQAAETIGQTTNTLRGLGSTGSLPTTGIMSGDVGLIGAENSARAAANSPRFIQQDQRVNQQGLDLVNRSAPQGAEGRTFTDAMDRRQAGMVEQAQREYDRARGQQAGVDMSRQQSGADLAANQGQKVPASQALDTVVRRDVMGVQDRTNRAFDQIDPDHVVMRDPIPLINRAEAIQGQQGPLNDPANVPPVVNRIAGLRPDAEAAAAGAVPADISFGHMQSIRPELNEAINQARRAGNYTAADRLREIRTVINEEVDRLAAEGGPAADGAQEALRIYREELAPVWNVGPKDPATQYRKDLNLDRFGTSTTKPSETADRFLGPKRPEDADSLQRVINASPTPDEARVAARQFLISDLAEKGVIQDGVIRPDALRRWRDNWGTAIDVAPDFRDEVTTMLARAQRGERLSGRLADQIAERQGTLNDVTQNTGALRLVLGKDPTAAVSAIFESGDPQRNTAAILQQVGTNQRARDGLKAAIKEYLLEDKTTGARQSTTTGDRPVSFPQLDKLFTKHENVLSQIFTPEEMNNLRGGHSFMRPLLNRAQQATTGSPTAERMAGFWNAAEIGLKARYGILKGGGVLRTLRLWADTLPSNTEAVKRLSQEMYFNPELAQHLLTKNVSSVNSPAWNAKLNALLSVKAGVQGKPQEQPQ